MKLTQCAHSIEKRFKGQRYVYSRTRCRRRVRDQGRPYEYCWQHRGPARDDLIDRVLR